METFINVSLNLLGGFRYTVLLFAYTLLIALPLGLIISFGSMSSFKPLRWLTRTFVWIIRGTPLMLQLIIVFYAPGLIWGISAFGRMEAAIIAFGINYSCYFSEIYRGGIEAIPKGQYEAGQVLGMKKGQIFLQIILLQVIKRILAPMSNEVITLVKDTSLARIIAITELIYIGQKYITASALLWPLFYTGVFYLVSCGLLTLLFQYTERKLKYFAV
ncbi:MAG: amino acid ABC transporter permease [Oscillospiraceae bacterium]|nr:amino acid ABC transporter permease [Oscillospiraceae bacterium]